MSDDNKTPEPWSIRRWKQLKDLERLLMDCESLNAGNGILQRIERLIKGAEKLRRWGDDSQSFWNFLQEQAIASEPMRKRRAKAKSSQPRAARKGGGL